MYLQEILEVAIGLVFLWMVISLTTMALQEWVANVLEWRAQYLEEAIRDMLADDHLADKLYQHPLIANLYRPSRKAGKAPRLPSYIPAQKFAAVLYDLVLTAGTRASPVRSFTAQVNQAIAGLKSPTQQADLRQDWEKVVRLADSLVATDLGADAVDTLRFQIQEFATAHPRLRPEIARLLVKVEEFYRQSPEELGLRLANLESQTSLPRFLLGLKSVRGKKTKLKDTLAAMLRNLDTGMTKGEQAVASLRVQMETWFNDGMDRLSGTYKRKSQLFAFTTGVILALIFNVDSVTVAINLWREPTLRQTIIAQAEAYTPATPPEGSAVAAPLQTISELKQQLEALDIPVGWTTDPFDTNGRQCSLLPMKPDQVWGFPSRDAEGEAICKHVDNLPVDAFDWLLKFMGVMITGAAAAQGAPFWFEILKKLVNVRSSGVNPSEKKPVG